ncbi:fatty acid hydroxylase [Lysobacter enzymogenes]|uniref:sterol desaturase family protein n=1 Tax=Lysobacter enzymogenes TaxID=69 RepID=UPI0019D0770A|nr:sterol desaturase family protein [Lysobacter enzymogenes]MBN7136101.1 fatty acid hydroxylase [Lysobacter enzymogenes]
MDLGSQAVHELVGFFGLGALLELLASEGYRGLLSGAGVKALLFPVIPALLVYELLRTIARRRFKLEDYKIPFLTMLANRLIGAVLSFGVVALCIALLQPLALFQVEVSGWGLVYGYVVWEFAHFVYHYLAHKVRLLWCLHSTHHAPTAMNLSVNYAHLFLEAPYADLVRTSICILAGVSPPLLLLIMLIDGFWGQFIHLGEHALQDGRLGRLHRWILTPAHHRVHHARNPLYMDTNFCNLLNIWDRAFGTYQPQREDIRIEYGITRPMKPGSFFDAYLGEFRALLRDVSAAPGLRNKLLYLLMPPGWSHDGRYKTAVQSKREWLAQRQEAV